MKILKAEQIRKADQHTIENEPIQSIDLMERASMAFVTWFELNFERNRKVFVFCGTGNNGGDGLAISRILGSRKWDVSTIVVKESSKKTNDFIINYRRLSENQKITKVELLADLEVDLQKKDIVLDAIFGSGLTREVKGIHADVINYINESSATTISIDVPSGLFIDADSPGGSIISADHVLSFQLPKLAFLLPQNGKYVKNWAIADIGLDLDYIATRDSSFEYIDPLFAKHLIKPRDRFAHKTDFGRILLIAGSWGKMGACVLSTKASIRSGAGLVTAHIPNCGYSIMQTSVPEAMVSTDPGEHFLTNIPEINQYDAIGIGPGIDKQVDSYEVIAQLFKKYKRPIVVDADALNILSEEKSLLKLLPENSILTPHPGEFKRLVGPWSDDFERLTLQKATSKKYNVFIVLKGAHTSVSTPNGKVYFNSTGNPGMATGGSGDVLTGIITALLGQKYTPEHASLLGVYLHGLAADIAVDYIGEESLSAGDIIDYIPQAFMELKR